MKKREIRISNQDEFNKYLQHTSPFTWIILVLVVALLVAFFVWSVLNKVTIKLMGKANINQGEVTLYVKEVDLDKLQAGQKVYINDKEGEILSFRDNKQPVISNFSLTDGEYTYTVVLQQKRPFDFLIGK